jgi:pimeloyl-ACP methyl ester carboxylesterase
MRDHPNKRAIVIGASMGGMLAARVLADYCDEVTVSNETRTQRV